MDCRVIERCFRYYFFVVVCGPNAFSFELNWRCTKDSFFLFWRWLSAFHKTFCYMIQERNYSIEERNNSNLWNFTISVGCRHGDRKGSINVDQGSDSTRSGSFIWRPLKITFPGSENDKTVNVDGSRRRSKLNVMPLIPFLQPPKRAWCEFSRAHWKKWWITKRRRTKTEK